MRKKLLLIFILILGILIPVNAKEDNFIANENVDSKVIIMTMLKQLSVVISIILGKIIFKEKNIIKKLIYSLLIIGGIGIMFIF